MASDQRSKRTRKVRERIASLEQDERRRLYKHAARMRRAASQEQSRPKHRPDYESWTDEDDALPPRLEKRRRRHRGSLRQWAEALVADDDLGQGAVLTGPEPDAEGLVLSATSARCRVLCSDGGVLDCRIAPDLADAQRSELAVGDRVQLVCDAAEPSVVGLQPRTSVLSRPDSGPGGRHFERVIAANIDLVVVVASACDPPLRPRLVDRYLVATSKGGARAALAITKTDLLEDPLGGSRRVRGPGSLRQLEEQLAPYRKLALPVLPCSSTRSLGLGGLREVLRGRQAVLVGQSGVGKSSLLNALEPRLRIAARETGKARKGRHTTTASTLYVLDDETRVIDTPGIREFGLWEMSAAELRSYFPEFDAWSARCRFGDCSHVHEPSCAVREAANRGDLNPSRYDSYLRLWDDLS